MGSAPTRASPQMSEQPMGRREIISKVLGAAALVSATAANADIDYAGVGFLGGSSTIDVNNANIRVYTKLPYKGKEDMYSKCGFTAAQAEATKKYDGKFIFLEPRPEYVIDNINNGLYR